MVVRMVLHIVKFVNGFPRQGGMKHYSPGEIMTDCRLNANNIQLGFGVYCQVAENDEPRNSLVPRMRAAISLGNSGNLSGGQMFLLLDTEHTITRHHWVVLHMPPAVIARVNLFGKNEPSILTFTNRHGRKIGDHSQGYYEPSGIDDNSVVRLILDEIPGVDPAPEDDVELPGEDMDFDAETTGVEVDSDYVPQELTKVNGLGQQDTSAAPDEEPSAEPPTALTVETHVSSPKKWMAARNARNRGMVQAWVGHFVTPLKCTYNKYDWQVTSQKPHKKHKSPNKNHHHGGEAACPSSEVDLMNPCCMRGGWPYACTLQCPHRSDLIDSIN
jgi:hypothetical protein